MPVTTWTYEFTDTFGGEANYCWVRRGEVRASSRRGAIMLAKRKEGYACRHNTSDFGGSVRIDLRGANICGFIEQKGS